MTPRNTFLPCWLRRFGRFLALGSAALVCTTWSAAADEVTLAWDRSPEINVTGYRVYYGTSTRAYLGFVTVSNTTTARLTGLATGAKYYFAVTAVNSAGIQSGYSSEISHIIGTDPNVGTPPAGSLVMGLSNLRQPVLTGKMTPGASYDVLFAMSPTGAWSTLGTVTAGADGTVTFTDPTKVDTQPLRFYRLRQK